MDSLKENPQILIENVVKKVVLYDDSVTIYFNNPIAESLDEHQVFLFYEKKHNYKLALEVDRDFGSFSMKNTFRNQN